LIFAKVYSEEELSLEISSTKLKVRRVFCENQNSAKCDIFFQLGATSLANLPRIVPFRICWHRFLPVDVLPFQLAIGVISGLRRSLGQRPRKMFHNYDWNIGGSVFMVSLFPFVYIARSILSAPLFIEDRRRGWKEN
jgi:hypothetical protein